MKTLVLTLGLALLSFIAFNQNYSKEHYNLKLDEININISKDVGNLSLYYARADIYDVLDDFQNATVDYLRVVDLYQKKPDTRYIGEYTKSCYLLADDYFFRSSNKEKAMKYVVNGLEVAGDFKDLEVLEAILLGVDPAKQDLANNKYEMLSKKYPEDVRLNMYHAKFLEKTSPLESAVLYEKVLAADPLNKEALLSLGTIYNNEASKLSELVISDPTKIFELAQKAALYFEKLHKQDPTDKELTNVLVRLYVELDEREKAKLLDPSTPY